MEKKYVRRDYRAASTEADFGWDVVSSHPPTSDGCEQNGPHGEHCCSVGRTYSQSETRYTNKPNYSAALYPDSVPVEIMSQQKIETPALRTFESGATRHSDTDKYDYEGFLSPMALEAFAAYMHVNRRTADGGLRDSDNWQKGIPVDAYMKSGFRHFLETWKAHRGYETEEGELAAACGVLFNIMGWIHERAKADPEWFERELEKFKRYRAAEIASRK